MIGTSREWDGLYYLEGSNLKISDARKTRRTLVSSNSQNHDVHSWNCRSGHPSFEYMKHVFPTLFNKNSIPFHCETCQLAKQTRSSYPKQPYIPSSQFTLIHSDIWGPARIKTLTNARWFVIGSTSPIKESIRKKMLLLFNT